MGEHERDCDFFWIGGERVRPAAPRCAEVVCPSTEERVGRVALAARDDVGRAVRVARECFELGTWARRSPVERADVLDAVGAALEARADALAALATLEAGVPTRFATERRLGPASIWRHFARLGRAFAFREERKTASGTRAFVEREPVGVVGAIIPFNGSALASSAKLAPALAAGCSVVLKPAPETALEVHAVVEAAHAAGLPPGVLALVPGDGEAGRALVESPAVDKVAFTGSTAAGLEIAATCARRLARVTLELGGKAPAIVLPDADVEAAAEAIAGLAFFNSGQACIALSRVLAPRSRYDEVVAALRARAEALVVGDAADPRTTFGPLVSARHRERVEAHLASALAEGARAVTGGGRPARLARGFFVEPTVLVQVRNDMRIAREETFGPVTSVIPYGDVDEAIALANDSAYGLSGAVFTADEARGLDVARRVRAGSFGVNGYRLDFALPFGGVKLSGIGREFGPEGLAEYTEPKTIALW
jgi:acyl-CoA reductase-like NAD-dependent aldehyde dehydrogenase